MKRILLCLPLLLLLMVCPARAARLDMRGVWVSTVYNLDWPSRPGLSESQLKAEADAVIANARSWGMNALFLQVRPAADALYPSRIDPWSAVLSGSQGQAPDGGFDPLAYFTEQCHRAGMELHAWLNPYRITRTAAATREEAFAQLCDGHPARQLSDCVVFHSDGCLYYDPGQPRVRAQILKSVREILENYPVDGIHLDDYFYPGGSFADEGTFAACGGAFSDVGDFRRDAVDQLVAAIHALVREVRPEAAFGVSPAGIWATADRMEMGAATTGSQSYFDHYADSRKWVREGMVDYIAPQIYWEIGAVAGDFSVLLDWWSRTVADTGVDLYVGLAVYKSAAAAPDSVWYGPGELQRQLEAIAANENARGALFFRYASLCTGELPAMLTGQLAAETQPEPPETCWPTGLTIEGAGAHQSVLNGQQLPLECSAPRGSRVTVLYGADWRRLSSRFSGRYSGSVAAQAPHEGVSHTAPALVCAEKNGVLFIKLTDFTITSVEAEQTVSIEDIRWSDTHEGHKVVFYTQTPCAAALDHTGDVLTLDFSPCRLGVLFDDEAFDHMTAEQTGTRTRYRLVFPDDGQSRQVQQVWAPDSITLWIKKNSPDPSVPDR